MRKKWLYVITVVILFIASYVLISVVRDLTYKTYIPLYYLLVIPILIVLGIVSNMETFSGISHSDIKKSNTEVNILLIILLLLSIMYFYFYRPDFTMLVLSAYMLGNIISRFFLSQENRGRGKH